MVKESNTSLSSIKQLSERIKNGDLYSIDLVEVCLKTIHKFNPTLNSFLSIITERDIRMLKYLKKKSGRE
jgi:Asp-tRNA(Asn)/Glu-tRNA(Gln) amidotransferase A subunit family amidase